MTLAELKDRMTLWEMRLWSARMEYEAEQQAKADRQIRSKNRNRG